MSKHTDGLWEQHYYSPESAGKFGGEPGHYIIARQDERAVRICDVLTGPYIDHDRAEANARLIAAAPTLAEALNDIFNGC